MITDTDPMLEASSSGHRTPAAFLAQKRQKEKARLRLDKLRTQKKNAGDKQQVTVAQGGDSRRANQSRAISGMECGDRPRPAFPPPSSLSASTRTGETTGERIKACLMSASIMVPADVRLVGKHVTV